MRGFGTVEYPIRTRRCILLGGISVIIMIKISGLRQVGIGVILAMLAVSSLGVAGAEASELKRVIVKFPDLGKVIKLESAEVEIKKDDLGMVEEIRLRREIPDDDDKLLDEHHDDADTNRGPGSIKD